MMDLFLGCFMIIVIIESLIIVIFHKFPFGLIFSLLMIIYNYRKYKKDNYLIFIVQSILTLIFTNSWAIYEFICKLINKNYTNYSNDSFFDIGIYFIFNASLILYLIINKINEKNKFEGNRIRSIKKMDLKP